jgi:hypothetical protein
MNDELTIEIAKALLADKPLSPKFKNCRYGSELIDALAQLKEL